MERVQRLEKLILKHKALYYQGNPEIDDAEYDRLEEELRELDGNNKVLRLVGSSVDSSTKIKHSKKMLSLAKVYGIDEFEKWRKDRGVVGTYKIDGVSCSLIYKKGFLDLAKTRGDGIYGEDITNKTLWVANIPGTIDTTWETTEIRGELFCRNGMFGELAVEMIESGLEKPSSQRNIVAGLLLRKDHLELCRYLDFKAFDILAPHTLRTETEKGRYLSALGFDTPDFSYHEDRGSIERALNETKDPTTEKDYLIDGLVFTFDDTSLHPQMGETSHHPKYKMAFKYKSETKTTDIIGIDWQVSRNGILTPVANVKPVELSGATITRVTLHNYGIVFQHKLKKGDTIEIIRSGEVIPKFTAVKKSCQGDFKVPSSCPSCGGRLVVDDVRIKCINEQCLARIKEGILNFIHKIGIDDLSTKRLEELMKEGLVKDIADLYRLDIDNFLSLDKTQETLAKKLHRQIQNSKRVDLAAFLSSLGFKGGAYNRCSKIVDAGYDTIDAVLSLNADALEAVDGFAAKSATDFIDSLQKKEPLIRKLMDFGFTFATKEKKHGFLSGKKICITGTLSEKRPIIEEKIRQAGAEVVGSISKVTDFLVTGDPKGKTTKLKKAKSIGISIISEEELSRLIQQ